MPFCGNCGTAVESGVAFCPNCGEAIMPEVSSVQPDPTSVPEPSFGDLPPMSEAITEIPSMPEQPSASAMPEYNPIPERQTTYQQTASSYDTSAGYSNSNYGSSGYQNSPLSQQNVSTGMGIAAMVLGIISLAICCCYGIGIIPSIIALILGIVQNKKRPTGPATAGIVLGIIGILLNVTFLLYFIFIAAESGNFMEEFSNEFSSEFYDEFYDDYEEEFSFSIALQSILPFRK